MLTGAPLLFVYGTLRRMRGSAMHPLLAGRAAFEGTGTVQGQLFDLGRYPALVLSVEPSDRVIGEVYRLEPSRSEVTQRELDEYEGTEYRREEVSIRMADGATVEAWAYVWSGDPSGCRRIPSGEWHR